MPTATFRFGKVSGLCASAFFAERLSFFKLLGMVTRRVSEDEGKLFLAYASGFRDNTASERNGLLSFSFLEVGASGKLVISKGINSLPPFRGTPINARPKVPTAETQGVVASFSLLYTGGNS